MQGNFRVVLRPGSYVVRGPGGNQKIEVIRPHQWIKRSSRWSNSRVRFSAVRRSTSFLTRLVCR